MPGHTSPHSNSAPSLLSSGPSQPLRASLRQLEVDQNGTHRLIIIFVLTVVQNRRHSGLLSLCSEGLGRLGRCPGPQDETTGAATGAAIGGGGAGTCTVAPLEGVSVGLH